MKMCKDCGEVKDLSQFVPKASGIPVKDGRGKLYNPKTYKGYIWAWK